MILFTAAWVYIGILSPFFLLCGYWIIERQKVLTSPIVILPTVALGSFAFYEQFKTVAFAFYSHFLVGGALFIVCYSLLLFQWKYTGPQAVVLSLLTVIACDELWQMPFNILNWTHSWLYAATGLATGGFDLMSIPLIFYFLLRFGRSLAPSNRGATWGMLMAMAGLTLAEAARFHAIGFPTVTSTYPPYEPYYLIFPWFGFFLLLFRPAPSR